MLDLFLGYTEDRMLIVPARKWPSAAYVTSVSISCNKAIKMNTEASKKRSNDVSGQAGRQVTPGTDFCVIITAQLRKYACNQRHLLWWQCS